MQERGLWFRTTLNHAGGDQMFAVLIALAIGIVIGWNWPQPPWAKDLQDRVVETFQSLTGKGPK
jgi:hypothetical protein